MFSPHDGISSKYTTSWCNKDTLLPAPERMFSKFVHFLQQNILINGTQNPFYSRWEHMVNDFDP